MLTVQLQFNVWTEIPARWWRSALHRLCEPGDADEGGCVVSVPALPVAPGAIPLTTLSQISVRRTAAHLAKQLEGIDEAITIGLPLILAIELIHTVPSNKEDVTRRNRILSTGSLQPSK